VRWSRETPAIGVDPDVCVLEPPPPEGDALSSLRLWEPGHVAPILAVEIVSPTRADKDYLQSPAKYAVNGTGELWVFDPELAGPKDGGGGPYRIQVWRRGQEGDFLRVYAGAGPAWSATTKAWLVAVDEGKTLGLADDEQGTRLWLTGEQQAQRRAELLAERLRALGVDPDAID
jgi:Uma2 family endonuclease